MLLSLVQSVIISYKIKASSNYLLNKWGSKYLLNELAQSLSEEETAAMNSEGPRSTFSRFSSVLLHGAALVAVAALMPASFAQQVQPDTIPVKNWPLRKSSDQVLS